MTKLPESIWPQMTQLPVPHQLIGPRAPPSPYGPNAGQKEAQVMRSGTPLFENTSPDVLLRTLRRLQGPCTPPFIRSLRRDVCTGPCARRHVSSGQFSLRFEGWGGEAPSRVFLVHLTCSGCGRVRWVAFISEPQWLHDRSLEIDLRRYDSLRATPKKLSIHLSRKVKEAIAIAAAAMEPDRRSSWAKLGTVLEDED
jgi:hypothetical protein